MLSSDDIMDYVKQGTWLASYNGDPKTGRYFYRGTDRGATVAVTVFAPAHYALVAVACTDKLRQSRPTNMSSGSTAVTPTFGTSTS